MKISEEIVKKNRINTCFLYGSAAQKCLAAHRHGLADQGVLLTIINMRRLSNCAINQPLLIKRNFMRKYYQLNKYSKQQLGSSMTFFKLGLPVLKYSVSFSQINQFA